MKIDLSELITESSNPESQRIDCLSTIDMVKVINGEDKKVALAVEQVLPDIAQAIDAISHAFLHSGRLIYTGAGTSGRLGILDASECPPTYGTPAELVVGIIAGGHQAILKAVENAEDNVALGADDLRAIQLTANDVVVGIAASGRTPYVIGAMTYAKSLGCTVIGVTCNPNAPIANQADIAIVPVVGPEVITGSSRMKAGTAQKMVLNMLTTGSMVKIGKVFGNLMVDVEATNAKLVQRQVDIVMKATLCDVEQAKQALLATHQHCKTAIVMLLANLSAEDARKLLDRHQGFIRDALYEIGVNA